MKIGGQAADGADTIFALASGVGRSAVAVIRISGQSTSDVMRALLGGVLPEPRRASLRRLRAPGSDDLLDQALVLWLPGPGTFTGEDQAELQIHGSAAVRAALLRALADLPHCRAAEPGEFTRRAFAHGKLDLSAVEGLADLIDAETEAQRRQALRQLEGRLAETVEDWRERLLDALAACDAALDFSDEDDVPDDVAAGAAAASASVRAEIADALRNADRGERVREGFQVVIAGAPNAGKSTLLNALARRDVAIVSPIPGTTRDAIEIRCDLGGLPVTFVDTAGLRDSEDLVEREGISRARRRMEEADLVLWLVPSDDASTPPPHVETPAAQASQYPAHKRNSPLRHAEERPEAGCRSTHDAGASFETPASRAPQSLARNRKLCVPHAEVPAEGRPRSTHERCASFEARLRRAPQDQDVGSFRPGSQHDAVGTFGPSSQDEDVGEFDPAAQNDFIGGESSGAIAARSAPRQLVVLTKADLGSPSIEADLSVSALTGAGMAALLDRIQAIAAEAMTGASDAVLTRERHRRVLTDVVDCLDRAVLVGQGTAIELLAEDLRLALRHLGRITGVVDVEDVLDRIFSSFCIGK